MNEKLKATNPNLRLEMCINRSGKSYPIYKSLGGPELLGTLQPNDVFSWLEYYAGSHAYFTDVQIIYYKGQKGYIFDASDSDPVFTPILRCAEYKVDIMGKECSVFRAKRDVGVYDTSGNLVNTLHAGGYIGSSIYAPCGATKPYLFYADYWGDEDPSHENNFVDMGLRSRCKYNDVNFELHL